MAKKKGGKSKGSISQGKHSNVSSATRRAVRAARSPGERLLNQHKAWLAGKNVRVTIESPNKEETNNRFIKVSGDEYFGKGLPAKERKPYIVRGLYAGADE